MKLILILITLFTLSASAQTDSSQLYLPFQMKAKFAAVMTPLNPVLEDKQLLDSLKKAIGTGTLPEYLTTVNFKAGTYLKLVTIIADKPVAGYYSFAVEFFTSPLTGNGYTGLIPALDYYANNGTANQKGAAIWLRTQINSLLDRKGALLLEDEVRGAERALRTINYN